MVKIRQSLSEPGRRWLNVVLDLNGILCECKEARFTTPPITVWNRESDPFSSSVPSMIGPKAVYVRPHCEEFLSSLNEFADITVWSSMKVSTTKQICKCLFRRLTFPRNVLGQEQCEKIKVKAPNGRVTFLKVKGTEKDVFLKTLSKNLFPSFGGRYSASNTLVVDDSPMKHILNHPTNVILPDSWSSDSRGQSDAFLMGTLLPYLRHIHSRQNILLGRREQPKLGQRMVNENPHSREYIDVMKALDESVWL